jgi:peptidoglycan hydrolase-like protein with peptidoglycan-binding domain
MKGADVKSAQRILTREGYLAAGLADGVFGPVTGAACKKAKFKIGYALKDVVATYGSQLEAYLTGKRQPTNVMRVRARARAEAAKRKPAPNRIGAQAADVMSGWAVAGWKENPARSNFVPQLSDFARRQGVARYYYEMRYPWCSLAVFAAALSVGSKAARAGFDGKFNVLYTPSVQAAATSSTTGYGMTAISKTKAIKGTGLLFDFDGGVVDHIGLALGRPGENVTVAGKRYAPSNGSIVTVEGNTSMAGSQSNGGAVVIKVRSLDLVTTAFTLT